MNNQIANYVLNGLALPTPISAHVPSTFTNHLVAGQQIVLSYGALDNLISGQLSAYKTPGSAIMDIQTTDGRWMYGIPTTTRAVGSKFHPPLGGTSLGQMQQGRGVADTRVSAQYRANVTIYITLLQDISLIIPLVLTMFY